MSERPHPVDLLPWPDIKCYGGFHDDVCPGCGAGRAVQDDGLTTALHWHAVFHKDMLPCNEKCAPDILARLRAAPPLPDPEDARDGG